MDLPGRDGATGGNSTEKARAASPQTEGDQDEKDIVTLRDMNDLSRRSFTSKCTRDLIKASARRNIAVQIEC